MRSFVYGLVAVAFAVSCVRADAPQYVKDLQSSVYFHYMEVSGDYGDYCIAKSGADDEKVEANCCRDECILNGAASEDLETGDGHMDAGDCSYAEAQSEYNDFSSPWIDVISLWAEAENAYAQSDWQLAVNKYNECDDKLDDCEPYLPAMLYYMTEAEESYNDAYWAYYDVLMGMYY